MSSFVSNLAADKEFVAKYSQEKNGFGYIPWAVLYAHAKTQNGSTRVGGYLLQEYTHISGRLVEGFCRDDASETKIQLAVTDHKNKVINEPTAADVQNTIMRAIAKAISMHTGLGLSLWFGELQVGQGSEVDTYLDRIKSSPSKEALLALREELGGLVARQRVGKRDARSLREAYEARASELGL